MRKATHKLLKSIVKLRTTIGAARRRVTLDLDSRPTAAGASYGPVFDHLLAEITAVEHELAIAEDTYDAARSALHKLRERRRRVAGRLCTELEPVVRLLRCQTHLKGVRGVPTTTVPKQCPVALSRQARRTARFLRALERKSTELIRGVKIDAGDFARDLEIGRRRLDAAIVAIDLGEAEVVAAQERANRAFVEGKRVVTWVMRMGEGLCGLAGEEEIGQRMRESCR